MNTNIIAATGPLERIGVRLYRAEKPQRLIATLAPIDHEELIADHLADCWNACGTTPLPVVHAAPELLAALINLLGVIDGEGGTQPNARETARAAIAKATGEST